MKKIKALLISSLIFAPLISSCSSENPGTQIEEGQVKINLNYNEEGGSLTLNKDSFKVGDILKITIKVNKGYQLARLTINNERVKIVNNVCKYQIFDEKLNIDGFFEANKVIMSDFTFEYDEKNLEATIIKYKPDRNIIPYPFNIPLTTKKGDKEYKITGIKRGSLDNSSVEKIVISKNIKDIELNTFTNVSDLKEIDVDPLNPYFGSRNGVLYSKDYETLIAVPTEYQNLEFKIDNDVKHIAPCAFMNNRLIKKVIMDDSIITLGDKAFSEMKSLVDVKISPNIEVIPSYSFSGCISLINVTIPEGVVEIKDHAFESCTYLVEVTFPTTLKKIGKEAFYSLSSLNKINFKEGLEEIGKTCFGQNRSLVEVTLPKSLKVLGEMAFEACGNLKTCNLNEGLVYLGGAAFTLNPHIKEITIPSTVTTIPYNPFIGTGDGELKLNENNKNFVMKDGVLYSKDLKTLISVPYNFKGNKLEYKVPDAVTELSHRAFGMNLYLKKVTLPKSIQKTNCSFLELLPNQVTGEYELSIYYEGTKEEFEAIDHGLYAWNTLANFKDNVLHCSNGDVTLAPQLQEPNE